MANTNDSSSFQRIIHSAYGFGAALVIIGALFKIQHWAGASWMLTIGMGTEVVIFIISAFEAMPKKYKWENVYPELMDTSGAAVASVARKVNSTSSGSGFDFNLDQSQVNGIKDGIGKLSESLSHLSSLAAVSEGSKQLSANLANANQAVAGVAQTSVQLSTSLTSSSQTVANVGHASSALVETYQTTAKIISGFAEQTHIGIENAKKAAVAYGEQVNNLNRSISAVNSSFELQLKNNQQYQQSYGLLNNEVAALVGDVKKSVDSAAQLSNQMKSLTENVSRLNSVYGNMLTAITNLR